VTTPNSNPRRTKASARYAGVYFRVGADGKKDYELDLRAVGGGWETIGPQPSLQAAVALRADRISRAQLRGEQLTSGPGPTFGEVRREWVAARKVREGTGANYDSNLRLYAAGFESKPIRSLTRGQLTLWLGQLRSARTGEQLSEGTAALVLAAVSAVFEYGVEIGALPRNPVRELTNRPRQGEGRRRILSHDEEARLLAVCEQRFPWLGDLVTVALYQALRLGEVAGLQSEDVDLEGGKLRVHQQLRSRTTERGPTKGATSRRRDPRDVHPIDLMPAAHAVLRRLCETGPGFIFRTRTGSPKAHRDIGRAFQKAVEYAGIPVTENGAVTFHALRHTGISRLANHPSIPLVYVRHFAGHTSLTTTETYVHKIDSAAVTAAAVEAMGAQAVELPQVATGLRRVK
jgi:integrase